MSTEQGVVQTYLLGNATDLSSTRRLLTLSRITHYVCFIVAIVGALSFAKAYLGNGEMWSRPPDQIIAVLQYVVNEMLWLFVTGIGLVGAFVSWLNTDVLVNRQVMLQLAAGVQSTPQAVVQVASAETTATAGV